MVFAKAAKAAFPVIGALALTACGGEQQETTYDTNVADQSGGELIVTDPDANAVDVQLPETPMTPVPPMTETTESPSTDRTPTN